MADSDLTRPLGTGPRRSGGSLPLAIVLTLLGGALVGGAAWLMLSSDMAGSDAPDGGVAVAIEDEPEPEGGEVVIRAAEGGGEGVVILTPDGLPADGGVRISDPFGDVGAALPVEPLPQLIETTAIGRLPVVADGLRPFDAYRRQPGAAVSGRPPRIAIIVGGIGIGQAGSQRALDLLPGEVSIALAPYGQDLEAWGERARADGHEVLLQVPMEPFDFDVNDPGPETLIVGDSAQENIARLEWLMARFTAYAGVVTYAGGRFTSEPAALRPVVDELARRGLMLVDDGSSPRSRSSEVAAGALPFAQADLVLDAEVNAGAITAALARLEDIARQRGYAIATASAFGATVDAIARWAETAATRGIDLVPVTSLANDPGPSSDEDAIVIEVE